MTVLTAHERGFLSKVVHMDGAKTSKVLSFSSYFHPDKGQYRTSNKHGIIGTKHMCSLNTTDKKNKDGSVNCKSHLF